MIESEFKCLLDLNHYEIILNELKKDFSLKSFIQVNYFYDSNNYELDKHDITFRIRQKENNLQMQLKCPVKRDGILTVKQELSEDIKDLPTKICTEASKWSELLPYKGDIFLLGVLITERTKCNLNEAIEIDLDRNYYLGLVDYELEVEFGDGFKDEALSFVKDVVKDKEIKNVVGGKRDRFFYRLKQMSNKG